jgi:hypothetical protein
MKRMRHRTRLFLVSLLLVVAATSACAHGPTEPESLGGQTGSMTATIDGTPWTATSVSITQGSGIVVIQAQGPLSGGNALISLVMPSSVGTYTLGLTPGRTGAQGATLSVGGAVLWSADTTNGNGSLTFTSLNSTKATGTYFMSLAPIVVTGATGTRVISSGVFDVNF